MLSESVFSPAIIVGLVLSLLVFAGGLGLLFLALRDKAAINHSLVFWGGFMSCSGLVLLTLVLLASFREPTPIHLYAGAQVVVNSVR